VRTRRATQLPDGLLQMPELQVAVKPPENPGSHVALQVPASGVGWPSLQSSAGHWAVGGSQGFQCSCWATEFGPQDSTVCIPHVAWRDAFTATAVVCSLQALDSAVNAGWAFQQHGEVGSAIP